MIILVISLLLVVFSFALSMKGCGVVFRALYGSVIFAWSCFLLFFYMDAMVRSVVSGPPSDVIVNEFVRGILAYKAALSELRYALIATVFSAIILAVVPHESRKAQ
jgi:hypothetical protein